MRFFLLLVLTLVIIAIAGPAFAQGTNPYDVSWSALNPGNDWAAQVVQSLFPVNGATAGLPSTGKEATVIGQIIGQFTGFIAAIACAFVCYNTIMTIHRAAESSQILGSGQSWIFVARVGFAAIMMFPLGGGFSAGQQLVEQGALWGVGMAKALYSHAIQAVGPDAVVIAQPMIPGTGDVVQGLINNELCMDLVNLAGGSSNQGGSQLVPTPTPLTGTSVTSTGTNGASDGFVTWRYSLSIGNESGNPVCGSVTINEPGQNVSTIGGVPVNMAGVQQAVLEGVLDGDIRSQVATVASQLWQTKDASALSALQGIYTTAVNDYTSELTSAATSEEASINSAIQSNATNARNGNLDLLTSEVQQSTLGWTSAGAYYLEIARLNAATLSLLSDSPIVTSPTYDGLGPTMSDDLAPLESAANSYMETLRTIATTSDGTAPPNGVPTTLASITSNQRGGSVVEEIFNSLHLSQWTLNQITHFLLPNSQMWTDPFGGLLALGQTLMNTALIAFGVAGLLSSTTASTGATLWNFLTGNWVGAAATVAGHALIKFLALPIFALLTGILVPGIIISYVLPMIPYVLWMAGVCGWIILVCEAMVAVPLWMLAHMTFGGDRLHGRGIEGWGLLFNVMFRPTLMVIGLFLGYFVYDCMSWLIRESFGIAAGFALDGGWFVTNMIGLVVLLNIFVMLHVTAALMSFRMVTLLPHHLPRLIGLAPANRVDTEQFYHQAAWGPGAQVATGTRYALQDGLSNAGGKTRNLPRSPTRAIGGPEGSSSDAMDTTLRATTDPGGEGQNSDE
ncbi:MAG: DotA/TraY family protein [Rhodospirillales bacterium]|nr:DotA/TraY family protein [Rhodospirillales bacterium]